MFGKRVPNCVKKEDIDKIDFCVNCGELTFEDLPESNHSGLRKWFKDKRRVLRQAPRRPRVPRQDPAQRLPICRREDELDAGFNRGRPGR